MSHRLAYKRTGTLRSIAAVGLLGLAGLSLAACSNSGPGERDRPPPVVTAAPAQTARFVERIEAVGTANANESVTVSAPVTERVVRLGFDDGDYVGRGQVLAVLAQAQEGAQLAEANARAAEAARASVPASKTPLRLLSR